jgi:hypothetical protein
MGWETQAASTQNSQSKLFQQLSHQQKSFLKHLDPTPKHLDLIALKAECPVGARQRLYFLSSC